MLNVWRSKDDKAIKFDQLIDYDVRNIFLEKSYAKYGGETIPRPFSKKSKLNISLDQYYKVSYNLFTLYDNWRAIKLY